jgi:hypothetical protein
MLNSLRALPLPGKWLQRDATTSGVACPVGCSGRKGRADHFKSSPSLFVFLHCRFFVCHIDEQWSTSSPLNSGVNLVNLQPWHSKPDSRSCGLRTTSHPRLSPLWMGFWHCAGVEERKEWPRGCEDLESGQGGHLQVTWVDILLFDKWSWTLQDQRKWGILVSAIISLLFFFLSQDLTM